MFCPSLGLTVKSRTNKSILSINEKLPQTSVHLHRNTFWIFPERELASVQLSFLWCTVLCIGTTENGFRHTWMHDAFSFMNTRCFHWVLWDLPSGGGSWKSEPGLLCLMAWSKPFRWRFQGISFKHTLACLFLKIMFSHLDKLRKAQNAHAAAAP